MEQKQRIELMEQLYEDVLNDIAPIKQKLLILKEYYVSGLWLYDFECDEQGLFDPSLKRGVLSQDGLHNLLQEKKELLNNPLT